MTHRNDPPSHEHTRQSIVICVQLVSPLTISSHLISSPLLSSPLLLHALLHPHYYSQGVIPCAPKVYYLTQRR